MKALFFGALVHSRVRCASTLEVACPNTVPEIEHETSICACGVVGSTSRRAGGHLLPRGGAAGLEQGVRVRWAQQWLNYRPSIPGPAPQK